MIWPTENRTLPVGMILFGDQRYRITTKTRIEDLGDAIAQVGLLNPPWVETHADGFRIVSGFRRFEAMRSLGISEIPVRLIPSETPELECRKLAVADNAFQRPLNVLEQSRALTLLAEFLEGAALAQTAGSLALPSHPAMIDKLLKLCRLPAALQTAILDQTLSTAMALELGRLGKIHGVAIVTIFRNLRMGLSTQREVLSMIREIALGQEVPMESVYESTKIRSILSDKSLAAPQKSAALRSHLKFRRYPRLSLAQDAFGRRLKEIDPGAGLQLVPPPYFEGSTYRVTLKFKNFKEAQRRMEALERMVAHPRFRSLFDG